MKVSIVVILLIVCAVATAQANEHVYCGRHLSQVISMLCWGPEAKRSENYLPAKRGGYYLPGNGVALSGMRGKRGPVDECCYKPCSVDELLTYC